MEKIAFKKSKYMVFLFFLMIFIINFGISGSLELSFDEAYYWLYSQNLSFGYFDHPPFVAFAIKFGTLIFGNTEIGVRFGSNVLAILSYILILKATDAKDNQFFIISLLSMPLISFAGILAIPDTPMLFSVSLYFYSLKRYLNVDSFKNSLLVSISITLMFYSKYHGMLIVVLTVLSQINLLKKKSFWMIFFLVILLYLPHVYWQYNHDFASFRFHLFGRGEKHFSLSNILNYLSGQILLLGIFNFFIYIFLFFKKNIKSSFEKVLIYNSYGFLLFLLVLSFRNQIEANWTLSVCVAFIILFSNKLNERELFIYKVTSSLPILLLVTIYLGAINLDYVSKQVDMKDNRLNEIIGWRDTRVNEIVRICDDAPIVADSYQIAAKLSFYTKKTIPAIHISSRDSQFSIWNFQKEIMRDAKICYLTTRKNTPQTVRVLSGYKDDIYILKNTSLENIAILNGITYENIIRRFK